MDQPAALPELVRPWRTATIVASGVAAVELVLLIVAGVILLGKTIAPHVRSSATHRSHPAERPAAPHPAPAKPHPVRHVAARLSRSHTTVIVLNGNGLQGAASAEASIAQSRGYRVSKVANAPHGGYAKTIVMYRPGYAGEAQRFARDLNHGLVEPLDGMKARQLHGAQLLVIIGAQR